MVLRKRRPPWHDADTRKLHCDWLHAQVFDDGAWVTIASVDGRYLSSDVCESFTGRVVGPYARQSVVDVRSIDYAGQDIER